MRHDFPEIELLLSAGRAISVTGGHASQPRFASFLPASADEARADVRSLRAAGVDAIKLMRAQWDQSSSACGLAVVRWQTRYFLGPLPRCSVVAYKSAARPRLT